MSYRSHSAATSRFREPIHTQLWWTGRKDDDIARLKRYLQKVTAFSLQSSSLLQSSPWIMEASANGTATDHHDPSTTAAAAALTTSISNTTNSNPTPPSFFNLFAVDCQGWTVLHHACRSGRLDIVEWILQRHVEQELQRLFLQEEQDKEHQHQHLEQQSPPSPSTPAAVRYDNHIFTGVGSLFDTTKNNNHHHQQQQKQQPQNNNVMTTISTSPLILFPNVHSKWNSLHHAVYRGDVEVVQALLQALAMSTDPCSRALQPTWLSSSASVSSSHQSNHAATGCLSSTTTHPDRLPITTPTPETIQAVNTLTSIGQGMLHLALCCSSSNSYHGHAYEDTVPVPPQQQRLVKLVDLLLTHQANVHQRDHDGITPLLHAILNYHDRKIHGTKQAGSSCQREPFTTTSAACTTSTPVELLLQYGANPKQPDHRGRTPFVEAVQRGQIDNIYLFLRWCDPLWCLSAEPAPEKMKLSSETV